MKNLVRSLSAFGGPAPSAIVVDEFGNGTYFNGSVTVTLASGQAADPFLGGLLHFAYTLPYSVGGQFQITLSEPNDPLDAYSDILVFVSDQFTTTLFFHSDGSDGLDAPADIAVLPKPTPAARLEETGLFGNPYSEAGPNGAVFDSSAYGGLLSDGNPAGTIYTFISEIPEPSTCAILAAGAAGLLALRRRK